MAVSLPFGFVSSLSKPGHMPVVGRFLDIADEVAAAEGWPT